MFNLIMDHLIFDPKLHPFGSLVANIDFIIIMQIWRAAGKTDYCRSLSLCSVHRMEDYVASKRATAPYSSRARGLGGGGLPRLQKSSRKPPLNGDHSQRGCIGK